MVILAAIGRFFKKIWDWIKQTAWIQPLLIVGIIFGVIFSIPSIVKAVKTGKDNKNKYEAYYHDFQISLELDDKNDSKSSPADKFTYALEEVQRGTSGAVESFKKSYGDLGNKFFVAYVAQDCEKCKDAKDGFELFEDSLNKKVDKFKTEDGETFHMVTIFTDEETSYTNTDTNETAFVQYLDRHSAFFEEVGSNAFQSDYCANGHLAEDDLNYLATADHENFLTPTIFLVELPTDKINPVNPGVTEVMFGVDGSTESSKAETLLDCWKHTGEFSVDHK